MSPMRVVEIPPMGECFEACDTLFKQEVCHARLSVFLEYVADKPFALKAGSKVYRPKDSQYRVFIETIQYVCKLLSKCPIHPRRFFPRKDWGGNDYMLKAIEDGLGVRASDILVTGFIRGRIYAKDIVMFEHFGDGPDERVRWNKRVVSRVEPLPDCSFRGFMGLKFVMVVEDERLFHKFVARIARDPFFPPGILVMCGLSFESAALSHFLETLDEPIFGYTPPNYKNLSTMIRWQSYVAQRGFWLRDCNQFEELTAYRCELMELLAKAEEPDEPPSRSAQEAHDLCLYQAESPAEEVGGIPVAEWLVDEARLLMEILRR
ncbi:hypothetical protein DICA4_F02718 [Diutina catenulata]